jgi:prepilin-type N-terminal cleavage/methylation domain-containing protein
MENCGRVGAFTLIELMVVMLIIGILASITVPAMKGMGKANRSAAAQRQLLDDIALARLRAINDRAPVYMVFAPPWVDQAFQLAPRTPAELRQMTNLLSDAYTAYALVSTRRVGDQPGRHTPRYLTEWKTLPQGLVFAPYKLRLGVTPPSTADVYTRSLPISKDLPFPNSRSIAGFPLPCLGFTPEGQLITQRDEVLTLAKGSVFVQRDAAGVPMRGQTPDVQLSPAVNLSLPPATQTNTYQFVRVNWLTGRAKVELPEFR